MKSIIRHVALSWGIALSAHSLFAQQPEVVVQTGHSNFVNSVAFSPDGKLLASGGEDGTIKFYDVVGGKEILGFRGDTERIICLRFTPDGKALMSSGQDGFIFWEVGTWKELRRWPFPNMWDITISPDGTLFVVARGTIVELRSMSTGSLLRTAEILDYPKHPTAFSPNGDTLAVGIGYRIIYLDPRTITPLRPELNNKYLGSEVDCLVYTPGGKLLYEVAHPLEDNPVIAVSPDGKLKAVARAGSVIRVESLGTGERRELQAHSRHIRSLSFSPDSKTLASASFQMVTLWDAETGRELRSFPCRAGVRIAKVAFSPDGKCVAFARGRKVTLWWLDANQEVRMFPAQERDIVSLEFSSDGKTLVTVPDYYPERLDKVNVWDVSSGKNIGSVTGLMAPFTFAPDGKTLAYLDDRSKLKLLGLQVSSDYFYPQGYKVLYDLGRTAQGRRIVFVRYGHAVILESRDGKDLWGRSVDGFSPDGKTAAWKRDTQITLKDGASVRTLRGHTAYVTSTAFNYDGTMLASCCGDEHPYMQDYSIRLWDVRAGKELGVLSGHTRKVNTVAFSPDGKLMASGSADGNVKLWDPVEQKELVTLIIIEDGDHVERVVVTPDNYYMASRAGLEGIAFRLGARAFPSEQFDLKCNRPDIVLRRIGSVPREIPDSYTVAYQKRLQRMNFEEDMLASDFHLPEVTILTPDLPISTTQKSITFRVKAQDTKYCLDRLNVYINDVPIDGVGGSSLRIKKVQTIEQQITLELSNGENKIQVSAHNEKGVESLRETATISYTGPAKTPDLYVVAIGTSRYQDSRYNLGFAAKDASDIVSAFDSQKGSLFGDVKALVLTDERVTQESIHGAKSFLRQSQVDDMALVFIAGHGLVDSDYNYFYGTYDIDFANPSIRGLAYSDIDELLDGIPARKKLLLLDACFSGEIDRSELQLAEANPGAESQGKVKMRAFIDKRGIRIKKGLVDNALMVQQDLFADLRRGTGAVVISSSSGDEYSFEGSEWNNGVFTYSVLEALKLKKAIGNGDGDIQVSELQKYVTERVRSLTNGGQNPTVRQENLADDFVVYSRSIKLRALKLTVGIEFAFIPGGIFQMGDIFNEGNQDEKPVHTVTLSDFYLSKHEVTVAQYRSFCEATGRQMPAPPWNEEWKDDQPITPVSWDDAAAFCQWIGGRLPTEAEWEYAAREGGKNIRYGNGQDIARPTEINFDGTSVGYATPNAAQGSGRRGLLPVGTFAPNALGLYDMSGNVAEHCADWYGEDYYKKSPKVNPQGPATGKHHVGRGGAHWSNPYCIRCTYRKGGGSGIRVALSAIQ